MPPVLLHLRARAGTSQPVTIRLPARARDYALYLATECPCEFPQYPGIDTRRLNAVFSYTSLSRPHCLGGVERITTLIQALRSKPAAFAPLTDRFRPHADHLGSLGGREESVTTRGDQRSHPFQGPYLDAQASQAVEGTSLITTTDLWQECRGVDRSELCPC
jgi:hypothetical protein